MSATIRFSTLGAWGLANLACSLLSGQTYTDLILADGEEVTLKPGVHHYNTVQAASGSKIILGSNIEIIVHGEDSEYEVPGWGTAILPAFYSEAQIIGIGPDGADGGDMRPLLDGRRGWNGYDLTIRVLNGFFYQWGQIHLYGSDGGNGGREIVGTGYSNDWYTYNGDGGNGGNGGDLTIIAKTGISIGKFIEVNGGDAGVGADYSHLVSAGQESTFPVTPSGNGGNGGHGGSIYLFSEGWIDVESLDTYGGEGGDGGENQKYCRLNDGSVPGTGGHGGDGGDITILCYGECETTYMEAYGGVAGRGGSGPFYHGSYNYDYDAGVRIPFSTSVGGALSGNGGNGGTILIKSKESLTLDLWGVGLSTYGGGAGRAGAAAQDAFEDYEIGPVTGSKPGVRGWGGDGGNITLVSPEVEGITEEDVSCRQGNYPPLNPGTPGVFTVKETAVRFFPETGVLTTDPVLEKAIAGEDVELVFTFTNDLDIPIVNVRLLTWPLDDSCCLPVISDTGEIEQPVPYGSYETENSRFTVEWPAAIAAGETIEWRFKVHIRENIAPRDVELSQCVILRGEYESEVFEDTYEKGEIVTKFSLPCKQLLNVLVTSEQMAASPGDTVVMDVEITNNAESAVTNVEVDLEELDAFLEWSSAPASPIMVPFIAAESSVTQHYSVVVEDPLPFPEPAVFAIDSRVRSAEIDWSDWFPGQPINLGKLLIWPQTPDYLFKSRSNCLPSTGLVLGAEDLALKNTDLEVTFTTSSEDADTGLPLTRISRLVEIDTHFQYSDDHSIRLIGIDNLITPNISAGDITGFPTRNLQAQSVYYKTVHNIFEGSLPKILEYGMGGNQRSSLDTGKERYPDVLADFAEEQTDMVERLDELNAVALVAMMTAEQHYSELVSGLNGMVSLWDLLPLVEGFIGRYIKHGVRGLGYLANTQLKNKALEIGTKTGLHMDIVDFAAEKLPLLGNPASRWNTKRKIYGEAYSLLLSETDSLEQIYKKTFMFQVGTGELVNNTISVINHFGEPFQEALANDYPFDSILDTLKLLDIKEELQPGSISNEEAREFLGWAIQTAIDATIRSYHRQGEDFLLSNTFKGSQDLAMAAAEIAKTKLRTESHAASGFEDVGEFGKSVFDPMTDIFMVGYLVPNKAVQNIAKTGAYVSDGLSRYASAQRAWAAGLFLYSVVDIMALATESLVMGNLAIEDHDWPDYSLDEAILAATRSPSLKSGKRLDWSPNLFEERYAQIESAVSADDFDSQYTLHLSLADSFEAEIAAEMGSLNRASLLLGSSFNLDAVKMTPAEVALAVNNYTNAALFAIRKRKDLLLSLWSNFLNQGDQESKTLVLDCIDTLRTAEGDLTSARAAISPLLNATSEPDGFYISLVKCPTTVEVHTDFDMTVSVNSYFVSPLDGSVDIELILPENGVLTTESNTSVTLQLSGGKASHTWSLQATETGLLNSNPFIIVKDETGRITDFYYGHILVEPVSAEGVVSEQSGGTLSTSDHAVVLTMNPGGSRSVQVYLDREWMPRLQGNGIAVVGQHHVVVEGYDSTTELMLEAPSTVTRLQIAYDEADIPTGYSESDIKVFHSVDGESWIALNTAVNTETNSVSADITAFGRFVLGIDDDQIPADPTGLTITNDEGFFTLSWNASHSADVAGYGIRVKLTDGVVHTIGAVDASTLTYTTEPLSEGSHQFEVYAFDAAGNPSSEQDSFEYSDAPNQAAGNVPEGYSVDVEVIQSEILPGGSASYLLSFSNWTDSATAVSIRLDAPDLINVDINASDFTLEENARIALRANVSPFKSPGNYSIEATILFGTSDTVNLSIPISVLSWNNPRQLTPANGLGIVRVSSQSDDSAHSIASILDADAATTWRSAQFQVENQEIVLEVGNLGIYSISRIDFLLGPVYPDKDTGMKPALINLYVSQTDTEADSFELIASEAIPVSATEHSITFNPSKEARYLKIVLVRNHGSNDHVEVAEISVSGTPMELPLSYETLRDFLLKRTSIPEENIDAYDLNGDGKIDVADLVRLMQ